MSVIPVEFGDMIDSTTLLVTSVQPFKTPSETADCRITCVGTYKEKDGSTYVDKEGVIRPSYSDTAYSKEFYIMSGLINKEDFKKLIGQQVTIQTFFGAKN